MKKTDNPHPAYPSRNPWGFPDLLPQPAEWTIPDNLTPYAYRQEIANRPTLLHFHVDDYRFQIVWNSPARGLAAVHSANAWAVCSPDFSLWTDTPFAEQIWNIYRSRWCARHWQEHSIPIIPTVNWSTPDSWRFCFDGIPTGQIVTLRTPKRFSTEHWANFYSGYQEMLRRLTPRAILWFTDRIHYRCTLDSVPKLQFSASNVRQRQKGIGRWVAEEWPRHAPRSPK